MVGHVCVEVMQAGWRDCLRPYEGGGVVQGAAGMDRRLMFVSGVVPP